ncbi:Phenylacetic acid degradation protein PaaD [Thermus sp. CCB_US3_UF1]|uniref:1,2-phenylacetyl-CoA epoxidase subunit PaaD n=1 Tax=unclassified Thermus TaxID=2619321 RepID=UPI000238A2F0|nr:MULTISPECIES: 1,2-phenylacetyl-CoA epoxidase subunit PaaD [unclassified Thermus]AEV16269.1 Phenylacetic acid degradation protein PaaD [Thermus sp. CCB_US3_UF1]MCS6867831.1 phenylacetate-CoA oxygenase subunit PaaJ [Thermus sp.]MCX7849999.1 phenylacetate-CoA oxygenase subunit PaaJ [Thermus sp.]MDW8018092.1 1,2-phenylacetyl-CoA epoxidase subunit PaaD [Thermus sp.]MDW8358319.1 1,2-phenylacetyl-CoA epoxidase subunit PaaD [Thermus sp.]
MVARYWEALKGVKDPEIPVLNIVEMGMILDLEAQGERVRVRFRPTFSGCPALQTIREEIQRALLAAGAQEVEVVEARTPWSTEALGEEAREKLLAYGIAPPLPLPLAEEDPPCPRCGSREVFLKNPFGSTLCKRLYQCAACGEPFEAFKAV